MAAKFGPLKRIKKKTGINRVEIFQKNSWVHRLVPQKNRRNFGRVDPVDPVAEKLRR
jgi:hypothetical protein